MSAIDSRTLGELLELIGGDQEALLELIETFQSEGSEIVDDMRASLADKDADVLRRAAHSMKSSAQDFGAIKLSTLSATLESLARDAWPDDADQRIDDIASEFVAVDTALTDYRHNVAS